MCLRTLPARRLPVPTWATFTCDYWSFIPLSFTHLWSCVVSSRHERRQMQEPGSTIIAIIFYKKNSLLLQFFFQDFIIQSFTHAFIHSWIQCFNRILTQSSSAIHLIIHLLLHSFFLFIDSLICAVIHHLLVC